MMHPLPNQTAVWHLLSPSSITTLLGFKTQATPPQRPPNKKARRAIPPNRATTRIDKLTLGHPASLCFTHPDRILLFICFMFPFDKHESSQWSILSFTIGYSQSSNRLQSTQQPLDPYFQKRTNLRYISLQQIKATEQLGWFLHQYL